MSEAGSPRPTLPLEHVPILVAFFDVSVLFVASLAAQFRVFGAGFYILNDVLIFTVIGLGMAVIALISQSCYSIRGILSQNAKIRVPILLVFLVYSFLFVAADDFFDVYPVLARFLKNQFFASVVGFALGRLMLHGMIRFAERRGVLRRRIAILGAGRQAAHLIDLASRQQSALNEIVGIYDDRLSRVGPEFHGKKIMGDSEALLESVRNNLIDEIIVAIPWSADERLKQVVDRLIELPVRLRIASDVAGFNYLGRSFSDELFVGLPMLNVANKPLSGWRTVLKEAEDKVLTPLIILMISPILLAVALAVKLDSKGPVIFKQKRFGFNNREFYVYKFRSMYAEDDPAAGRQQATRDDPRITRVGRIIRRTSLDELPQLFNVLEGTMSLVGPRPHSVDHNQIYSQEIQGYYQRHKVKPGITGWAQVNGLRGETETLEKMEYRVLYDIHYVENWSLLFDLEILALTALVGFVGKNAY